MKHTRGIDVAYSGDVARTLLARHEAGDTAAVTVYLSALVARAEAYRTADLTHEAAYVAAVAADDVAAAQAAQAVRIEALRTATKDHDRVLAGIVAAYGPVPVG